MPDETGSVNHAGGMPSHEPTDESRKQVETMAAMGIRQDAMATILDLDPKTLRKHYRRELDTGSTKATLKVAQSLFKQAVEQNNTAAQIFWMKARAGWREGVDLSHAGPDGGPIKQILEVSWKNIEPTPSA